MTEKSILSIQRKLPCVLGESLNGRTEHHGEEDVPACDISLKNLMLEPDEIDALLGDGMSKALFAKNGSKFAEPSEFVNRSKTPFELVAKFKDSRVVLFLGMDDDELVLEDCTIAKVRYEPKPGGLTAVSVQVQAKPEADEISKLYTHMNSDAHCKVRFGKIEKKGSDKQQELAMDATKKGGEDEDDGDDDGSEE